MGGRAIVTHISAEFGPHLPHIVFTDGKIVLIAGLSGTIGEITGSAEFSEFAVSRARICVDEATA
jgi:hypothetical protein